MFTITDIQFEYGDEEFRKGESLFTKKAISGLHRRSGICFGAVQGSHTYEVTVAENDCTDGTCTCYLGQNATLCKHVVALAIAAVHAYAPESAKLVADVVDQASCHGEVREPTQAEKDECAKYLEIGMKYMKSYRGPSSTWFRYQDSLSRGSRTILYAVSGVPVSKSLVDACIGTLKKLDTKVVRGIDDSDGTVGECMYQIVEVLNLAVTIHPVLAEYIEKKLPKGKAFDWEQGYWIWRNRTLVS